MTGPIDTDEFCCASLDLSQTKWVCAFSAPLSRRPSVQSFAGGSTEQLVGWLEKQRQRSEAFLGRPLKIVLCYESGYDGFWLARLLPTRGIRTIVFDPASFLRPRRGRIAKTDRLDAEDMIRTLRAWLSGDASVAREVRVPSIEEEDAKRLARERKHLVNERTRLIGRIKGVCALHGVRVRPHMISKRWARTLDQQLTGEGKPIPPFLRRELQRMLRRYEFLIALIREVESDTAKAVSDPESPFPQKPKVALLAKLAGVGQGSAAMLVAEVFVRTFENQRKLSSFLGLAPTPHASGEISRNKGISKAGCKLARSTLVELAWSWLRYQHDSALATWWRARFSKRGMRVRNIGIVALARKLVVAFWQFVEDGQVPEDALLKA